MCARANNLVDHEVFTSQLLCYLRDELRSVMSVVTRLWAGRSGVRVSVGASDLSLITSRPAVGFTRYVAGKLLLGNI